MSDRDFRSQIASTLRREMARRDIKHGDLAQKMVISPTHLSRLLGAQRDLTLEAADRLAKALGVQLGAYVLRARSESKEVVSELLADQLRRVLNVALTTRGMTQKSVAEAIGIGPSSLSDLLRGRYPISVTTADKILQVLNVQVELKLTIPDEINE